MTRPRERLAVIDLGSNSFRLVVFMAWEGWWRRTDEIYEPVRIGEGLAASGRLGEEPMRRALATLDVFDHFCRAAGLRGHSVDALATSAIRDAENAAGFLALARERTRLPIRVLSREEENRTNQDEKQFQRSSVVCLPIVMVSARTSSLFCLLG